MRFFIDEDLTDRLAHLLRQRGIDAVSSYETGRNGLPDAEQLRLAASEGRVVVTRNRDDFIALTLVAFQEQSPHIGVLIAPGRFNVQQIGRLADAIEAYAKAHPEGIPPYTYIFLKFE